MSAPVLRDYQLELVDAVWREMCTSPTTLAVLPTGGGKTVCIGELMRKSLEAAPGIRIVMVMGRIDLVRQTEAALARMIPRHMIGVYCGSMGRKEITRTITIASIQSISDVRIPTVNLLVVDEVHNLDQKEGGYLRFIEKAEQDNPKLKIVGFTATPFRVTGEIFGDNMLFKKVTYRKTIKDMITIGHLCEPKMKGSLNAFDTSQLRIRAGEYRQEDVDALVSDIAIVRKQVADALSRMADRKCVVWATANIAHCNMIADVLMDMGERCTTVHSKLRKENRSANLSMFMGGMFRHMSFVTVLSEGFDHPPIDCVVLMRPTRSPVLYVQTVGRGLRPHVDKSDCMVLDYGQVVKNLGPLDNPSVKGKRSIEGGEAVMKECPVCLSYVFGGCRNCSECNYEFPPPPKPHEKLDGVADGTTNILSQKSGPETLIVGPVEISMHEAKSGNQCVKIIYQDRNLVTKWGYGGVSEFFVISSHWAMERLERRLGILGASLPSIPFVGTVKVEGSFQLVKTKDGKYDRVESVKKIANESPSVKKEEDDNISFDFGANSPEEIGWV